MVGTDLCCLRINEVVIDEKLGDELRAALFQAIACNDNGLSNFLEA
jgi:hypothetical protein